MTRAERLEAARRYLKLTYQNMGDVINMSGAGVRKFIERDNVRDLYLDIFQKEFGISTNWVETGSGEMIVSTTGESDPEYNCNKVLSLIESNKENIPHSYDQIHHCVSHLQNELTNTKDKLIEQFEKYADLVDILRSEGFKI